MINERVYILVYIALSAGASWVWWWLDGSSIALGLAIISSLVWGLYHLAAILEEQRTRVSEVVVLVLRTDFHTLVLSGSGELPWAPCPIGAAQAEVAANLATYVAGAIPDVMARVYPGSPDRFDLDGIVWNFFEVRVRSAEAQELIRSHEFYGLLEGTEYVANDDVSPNTSLVLQAYFHARSGIRQPLWVEQPVSYSEKQAYTSDLACSPSWLYGFLALE